MPNHGPVHALRNECYACRLRPTRAYRCPKVATIFTCEQHGAIAEEILHELNYIKIALVLPIRSIRKL